MTLVGDPGDRMANLSSRARRRRREAEAAELATVRQVAHGRRALMFGLPELGPGNDGPHGTVRASSVARTLMAPASVTPPWRQPNVGVQPTPGQLRQMRPARPERDHWDERGDSVRRWAERSRRSSGYRPFSLRARRMTPCRARPTPAPTATAHAHPDTLSNVRRQACSRLPAVSFPRASAARRSEGRIARCSWGSGHPSR
jgi:hypothetical protein